MLRILIIFLLSISHGYSQEKAIIGHWVQEKLEYQNEKDNVVNENNTSKRWVIFEKNNTLKHGSFPDQISNTGTWEYDKKNKQIIIFFDNSIKQEGDKIIWEVTKLNKNEMIVGGNYPYIHFRKIKK